MRRWTTVFLLAMGASLGCPVFAQPVALTGTLDKIRELGTVYVGHREEAIPFSYLVEDKATGYTVEICARIVDKIKSRLDKPELKTVHVPLPGNLRFTLLVDGVVDLECGVSVNTKVRQLRMAFSPTIFESTTRLLVPAGSRLERIQDLNGKTVAVLAGTTAGRVVATATARRDIHVNQISAPDRLQAFEMLKNGKADAFIGDDALLLGTLLDSPDREKFSLMDEALATEPYAIVLRRDDPEFKALIDEVVTGMMKSGEMAELYRKWFESPVPSSGKSMGLPIRPALIQLFAKPSDAGI